MPEYDYEEALRKIKEYAERAQPEERRGPTQPHEFHEVEGWSNRVKDYFKSNMKRITMDLTEEDINRLVGTLITPKQLAWHKKHDIVVSTDEIVGFIEGTDELIYVAHGLELIHGKEGAKKIIDDLTLATEEYAKHDEPGPPKHDEDKRFGAGYKESKKRADTEGWPCGHRHISIRRYEKICCRPITIFWY